MTPQHTLSPQYHKTSIKKDAQHSPFTKFVQFN